MRQKVTYSEPSVAVLGDNLVLVGKPVSVPSPESRRIMNPDRVNHLYFPSGALKRIDVVIERSRSVSSWEDILIHEETPN